MTDLLCQIALSNACFAFVLAPPGVAGLCPFLVESRDVVGAEKTARLRRDLLRRPGAIDLQSQASILREFNFDSCRNPGLPGSPSPGHGQ